MQEKISGLLANQNTSNVSPLVEYKDVFDKNRYPEDLVLTVKQYATLKKLEGNSLINTLSRRAAQYYRLAKQSDPRTNSRNQIIYSGSDIIYLDEALKSVLDLD
jgi:hypothetical protein